MTPESPAVETRGTTGYVDRYACSIVSEGFDSATPQVAAAEMAAFVRDPATELWIEVTDRQTGYVTTVCVAPNEEDNRG